MTDQEYSKPELIAICKHRDCDHVVSVPNNGNFAGLHLTEEMLEHDHGMMAVQILGMYCPDCEQEITGMCGELEGNQITVLPCGHVVSVHEIYEFVDI